MLRRMFLDPATRAAQVDWESVARFLVATFRAETARAGETDRAAELVTELTGKSDDFARMWAENDVYSTGEGTKTIRHAAVGEINFEFSSFAIDSRPDLKMMIYNPADNLRRLTWLSMLRSKISAVRPTVRSRSCSRRTSPGRPIKTFNRRNSAELRGSRRHRHRKSPGAPD